MKIIGIIGGGQLGLMLIEYGIMKITKSCHLDLKILVLDDNPNCSCSSLTQKYANIEIIKGDLMDEDHINNFIDKCDIVTWEIEHFNTNVRQPEKIIPNVDTLKIIQNKILQKQFYTKNYIPTAKYTTGIYGADFFLNQTNNTISVVEAKNNLVLFSGGKIVVKQPLHGYDGRAVQVISVDEIDTILDKTVLIEEYITNKLELSVIVACDKNGKIYSYECVGMDFHDKTNILGEIHLALSFSFN